MTTNAPTPSAPPGAQRPPRSMAPREHGAYGQLVFPIATALGCGSPKLAAFLLVGGEFAAFAAHEPALVLSGQRGRRALREGAPRAKVRLVASLALAALLGAAGLALAPRSAAVAALAPAVLATFLARLAVTGREKTLVGELAAATAFGAAAAPIGIAAGLAPHAAFRIAALWALGLVASTIAVRGVTSLLNAARTRAFAAVAAIVPLAVAWRPLGPAETGGMAAVVLPAAAFAVLLAQPTRRRMPRVGWSLVVASVVAAGLVVWDARGPVAANQPDEAVEVEP